MPAKDRLYDQLQRQLAMELKKQGLTPDKYDSDFILGVIIHWLGQNGAALTGSGVRRFRR